MSVVTTEALRGHGFLHGMDVGDVARLAEFVRPVTLPAGSRLSEAGEAGEAASRFWLLRSGSVVLNVFVPAAGHVTVETLGIGDVLGWSWPFPPYQWRFGAVAREPVTAFELDKRAVRAMCAQDRELGYELTQRFLAVVLHRLRAARGRLIDLYVRRQSTGGQER